jgi:hypothetical protein
MAQVRIVVLENFQAGAHTTYQAGEVISAEAVDAERLVRDGVACFYSEFRQDMLMKGRSVASGDESGAADDSNGKQSGDSNSNEGEQESTSGDESGAAE